MPETFFQNFPYSGKCDLIPLTPHYWQPCVSQFCDVTKSLLQISTASLGLQLAVAKFSDLVKLLTAIPVGKLWVLDLAYYSTVLLR